MLRYVFLLSLCIKFSLLLQAQTDYVFPTETVETLLADQAYNTLDSLLALAESASLESQNAKNIEQLASSYSSLFRQLGDPRKVSTYARLVGDWEQYDFVYPSTYTKLYGEMAGMYQAIQEPERGIAAAFRARHWYLQQADSLSLRRAELENTLSRLYTNFGELEKAKRCMDEALAIATLHQADPQSIPYLLEIHLTYGVWHKEMLDVEASALAYERALHYAQQGELTMKVGQISYNLGNILLKDWQHQRALAHLHRAESIFTLVLGERHPYLIMTYHLISQANEFFSESERTVYAERAYELARAIYPTADPNKGLSALVLGRVWVDKQEAHKGLAKYYEAATNFQHTLPARHSLRLQLYEKLLAYYSKVEVIHADSIRKYNALLNEQYTQLYWEEYPNLAHSDALLYRGLAQLGEFDEFFLWEESILQLLLNSSQQYQGLDAPLTAFLNLDLCLHVFPDLAAIYEYAYAHTGNASYLQRSYAYFDKACRLKELRLKRNPNGWNEAARLATNSLERERYRLAARLYELDGSLSENELDTLIQQASRYKAQSLITSFQETKARHIHDVPDELFAQQKHMADSIKRLEVLVFESNEALSDSARYELRDVQLFNLYQAYNAFMDELEANYPDYYHTKFSPLPVAIQEYTNTLATNEAVLEYIYLNDTAYHLIIIGAQECQLIPLRIDPTFGTQLKDWQQLLNSTALYQPDNLAQLDSLNALLYGQLVAPALPYLKDKEKLTIIGDNILYTIPFEALYRPEDKGQIQDKNFLIRDYSFSYQYSTTLHHLSLIKEPYASEQVIAFAPVFTQGESMVSLDLTRGQTPAQTRTLDSLGRFAPLPFTVLEVEALANSFDNNSENTNLLLHHQASKDRLLSALQTEGEILHIASHSFVNYALPDYSGIACASIDESTDKGILYVGEIYQYEVPYELVVLSSCESGLGTLRLGEGMKAFNHALTYAGAHNVISSLWKVHDHTTTLLMGSFYEEVAGGKPYCQALQSAKVQMLRDITTALPMYWAPFQLFGR